MLSVIRSLDRADDDRWDAFVRAHPSGTFFHLLGWRRVIRRAFGHDPHYLYLERDGAITAVLPMFEVGATPFPKAMVAILYMVPLLHLIT